MNYRSIARHALITLLFAWGLFALFATATYDFGGMPELGLLSAIGPVLALMSAFALFRRYKFARYTMYALLLFQVLVAGVAIAWMPRTLLPALLAAAVILGMTVAVHVLTRNASPPPGRHAAKEAGLFVTYLFAVVACLYAMALIRGPQPMQNIKGFISVS